MEAITPDDVYKIMQNFGKLYAIMSDEEKKSPVIKGSCGFGTKMDACFKFPQSGCRETDLPRGIVFAWGESYLLAKFSFPLLSSKINSKISSTLQLSHTLNHKMEGFVI